MAILIIRLIFSAVSTFVLSNNANIIDSALTNLFCCCRHLQVRQILFVQSDIATKKSSILSVAFLSLFSLVKNTSSSLLVASDSRVWVAVSDSIKLKQFFAEFFFIVT